MTREEVCMAGYNVVRSAGHAKTKLFDALESACCGNYEKAQDLINKASELICQAQSFQHLFEEQVDEADCKAVNVVAEHGNDHLMTTMVFRDLVVDLTQPGCHEPAELRTAFKYYH